VTTDFEHLAVEAVSRHFGRRRAIHRISFNAHAGTIVGLLGPNGAGKSTLLSLMATLLRPSSGRIRYGAAAVFGERSGSDIEVGAPVRARIGMLGHDLYLYPELTARENLAFFARLHDLPRQRLEERVGWALERAGLVDRADDRVETYSGGMKRRLNIVAALLHEPELVFLDEPTVGIDPQSRNHIFEMVEAMRGAGTTIVYTTHQLGEVERLCDRIVILDHGRVVAQGTLAELAERGTRTRPKRVRVALAARADEAMRALASSGIPFEMEDEPVDLEEIFLSLTGRGLRDVS
jgi:linearmycin/streptolysin S transport system ATP-binding protein